MTCANAPRCAIGQRSSTGHGAERVSRTPHWTRLGSAWHRGLCCSPCVSARGGAPRLLGPDPVAVDWTAAPALALWRAVLPVHGGCPSPAPGPHGHTHGVAPPRCRGRYEGTETFRGRRGAPPCFSARAIALVTAPPEVCGADTGCLGHTQPSSQHTLPETDDTRTNAAEKIVKIRSQGTSVS